MMDEELPRDDEELDLLERKQRMEEIKKWRFIIFLTEILIMVGLIGIALWVNGASSDPFYLPVEYPIYIILAIILAITVEDFFFDERRMRHLTVKLKRRFVESRIKSVLVGLVVSLILAITIWLPALHEFVNNDITRKGELHVYLGGGEGNYQFTSQDELALTQLDRVNIQNAQKIKMTIYLVRLDVNKRLIAESSTNGEKDDELYRAKLKDNCMWSGYGSNVNFYPKDLKPGVKMPFGEYLFVCFNDDENSDADVTLTFYRYVPRQFINNLVIFCILFFIADCCWLAYLFNLRKKFAELQEEEPIKLGKTSQRSAWTGEQVSCPACGTVFPVYSNLRPIRVKCPECGKEGVLGYPPQPTPVPFVPLASTQPQVQALRQVRQFQLPQPTNNANLTPNTINTQQPQQTSITSPAPTPKPIGTLPERKPEMQPQQTSITSPAPTPKPIGTLPERKPEMQPQQSSITSPAPTPKPIGTLPEKKPEMQTQQNIQTQNIGTLPQKTQSILQTTVGAQTQPQPTHQAVTQPTSQPAPQVTYPGQKAKGKELDKTKLATLQSIDIALGKLPSKPEANPEPKPDNISQGKTSIRCPGCKTTFEVGTERPLQVRCPKCGKSGTLR